jgi:L-asparaginase II
VGPAPLVRVVRSGLEEAVHAGHVAVCDADGRLVAFAGDADRRVFARSCMKPLQAAVAFRAIGEELPDREAAIICASHNGEPVHVGAVRAVLARAGLDADALLTPPGWPLDTESMARSQHKHPILHNCSGKHAGMLLACVRTGWDRTTYPRRSHPLQRRIVRAVSSTTGVGDIAVGIDGCGVPVHGMPLRAMATLFARLARPERLGDLAPEAERAVGAMLSEPYLVGGRHREDTAVMETTGDVVAKGGAEGLACAGILPSGLGVAVKVEDGGYRAVAPALIRALATVDGVRAAQVAKLSRYARPRVPGGGRTVGALETVLELRPASRRR